MAGITMLALLISVIVGGFYILSYYIGIHVDPREPPFISSKVPYIGHAIAFLRNGHNYWIQLKSKSGLPVFTVNLANKKIYVITSLDFVNSVHRNSKTLSFAPFVTMTAEKLSSLQTEQVKLFEPHEGRKGLSVDTINGVEATLRQADIDDMANSLTSRMKEIIDDIPASQGRPIKLLAWVSHIITQASTRAVYGPKNPFYDSAVEDGFWVFERNASILLNGFLPQAAGRKGLAARDVVANALTQYYSNGDWEEASALAKSKRQGPASYGFDEAEAAKIEVPFLIGVLNNTVPSNFWVLSEVFSDHTLLSAIRSEVSAAVESSTSKHIINIGLLKRKCPLLLSVYQETLRKRTSFSAARFVIADTTISNGTTTYLLKQGSIAYVNSDAIHEDAANWGPDAPNKDLHRFIDPSKKKKHPLAFRAFGGAPYICPGRHFATTEVMAIVAMLSMRFDMEPVGGKWKIPKEKLNMFGSVLPPAEDIEVVFKERKGWGGEWEFNVGEKGLPWALESG